MPLKNISSKFSPYFFRAALATVMFAVLFCQPLAAIAETQTSTISFDDNSTSTPITDETSTSTATTTLPTLAETEAAVRSYFTDNPVMITIAKCESGFRQFNDNGTALISKNKLYVGVFQIDYKIHAAAALKIGLDIYTLDGNLGYAKHLFDRAGAKLWPVCARNADAVVNYSLTKNLKIGDTNSQVKTLQQLLNNAGFTIAKTGNGSPGRETTTFGSMTKTAVKRFQCAKKIVCQGNETITGYGHVGPRTRVILLQAN